MQCDLVQREDYHSQVYYAHWIDTDNNGVCSCQYQYNTQAYTTVVSINTMCIVDLAVIPSYQVTKSWGKLQ